MDAVIVGLVLGIPTYIAWRALTYWIGSQRHEAHCAQCTPSRNTLTNHMPQNEYGQQPFVATESSRVQREILKSWQEPEGRLKEQATYIHSDRGEKTYGEYGQLLEGRPIEIKVDATGNWVEVKR